MNTFNLSRFIRFFFNEWKMTAKQYGLLLGAMMLFAIIICILINEGMYGVDLDAWMFWSIALFFWLAQGFNTSIQLEAFSAKSKKTALLLQPVLKAEFLAAKMFSCFVLFPLLYIGYIWVVAVLISRYNLLTIDNTNILIGRTLHTYPFWDKAAWFGAKFWFLATAVYWTGAFSFGKYAVVKSTLTVVVVYAILMGFSHLLLGLGYGFWDGMSLPLYFNVVKKVGFWEANYVVPHFLEAALLLSGLVLVVISVFKYRETTL